MRVLCIISIALVTAMACKEKPQTRQLSPQEMEEQLIQMNERMTGQEKESIEAYIQEKDWPMDSTGTGLRIWIYEAVAGQKAIPGQVAEVSFVVNLLDGTECYRTPEGETRTFKVEQSDVESGLHEAIQLMSAGDKAKIILPSHLAYGLAGDLNKIPLKSTLVYDITLHSLR
ncbi:MAG: hypothetical protein HKN79_00865 [Flavobacteriales bacterium]|nr:hypothetical protein [Flavobacteriales bacterium]